jgi:hypothetical protein
MGILDQIFRGTLYPKHSRRKPITYIDKNGYSRFIDSNRSVHRWKAEKKLGRKLRPNEVIHHRNRNKLDNRSENLAICSSQSEHHMRHVIHKKITGKW